MDAVVLRASLLGDVSLTLGEKRIDDSQNRSKKVWLLLAYLLHHHRRVIPQSELMDLFWNEESKGTNPGNALKTTLHRARTMLDRLEPGMGHMLILSKNGGYAWNPDVPLELDTEEFDRLCREGELGEADDGLARCRQALTLYRGNFLGKLSSETWVMPIAAHYHTQYIRVVQMALEQMETHGMWEEAAGICREALRQEPYQEDFYQHLMRNLLAMGQQKQAITVYEEMSKLLLTDFGIMPDQESRALYREACREAETPSIPSDTLRDLLQESGEITGALYCEYDFFKLLYQAQARAIYRSGEVIHIALFSLHGQNKKPLARRSLDVAMENLQELFVSSLRKGDIISRCSASQFIIMLPQANYENSCLVCQRLIKSFNRQYPHSPATIHYSVHPLEPSIGKPTARD